MAQLIAYFSRADENYFSGALRVIPVGNTEVAAQMIQEITGVNTDELVHTARSSSACFPVFQCTLSAA